MAEHAAIGIYQDINVAYAGFGSPLSLTSLTILDSEPSTMRPSLRSIMQTAGDILAGQMSPPSLPLPSFHRDPLKSGSRSLDRLVVYPTHHLQQHQTTLQTRIIIEAGKHCTFQDYPRNIESTTSELNPHLSSHLGDSAADFVPRHSALTHHGTTVLNKVSGRQNKLWFGPAKNPSLEQPCPAPPYQVPLPAAPTAPSAIKGVKGSPRK